MEGVRGDGASGWLALDGLDLGITLIKPWSKLSITQLKPQRPPLRPLYKLDHGISREREALEESDLLGSM